MFYFYFCLEIKRKLWYNYIAELHWLGINGISVINMLYGVRRRVIAIASTELIKILLLLLERLAAVLVSTLTDIALKKVLQSLFVCYILAL